MSEQVGYFEAGPLLGNYEVLFRWVKRIKLYKPNLSNPKFQRISGWHNPVILWILYLTYFYMSEWTGLLLLQLLDHISLPSILYFKNESSWNTYNNITDWKSQCDIYIREMNIWYFLDRIHYLKSIHLIQTNFAHTICPSSNVVEL